MKKIDDTEIRDLAEDFAKRAQACRSKLALCNDSTGRITGDGDCAERLFGKASAYQHCAEMLHELLARHGWES